MTFYSLDAYSDEELGRLIRSAANGGTYSAREHVSSRTALSAFFRLIGLGQFADVVLLAEYVWERLRRLVQSIFA